MTEVAQLLEVLKVHHLLEGAEVGVKIRVGLVMILPPMDLLPDLFQD